MLPETTGNPLPRRLRNAPRSSPLLKQQRDVTNPVAVSEMQPLRQIQMNWEADLPVRFQ